MAFIQERLTKFESDIAACTDDEEGLAHVFQFMKSAFILLFSDNSAFVSGRRA